MTVLYKKITIEGLIFKGKQLTWQNLRLIANGGTDVES